VSRGWTQLQESEWYKINTAPSAAVWADSFRMSSSLQTDICACASQPVAEPMRGDNAAHDNYAAVGWIAWHPAAITVPDRLVPASDRWYRWAPGGGGAVRLGIIKTHTHASSVLLLAIRPRAREMGGPLFKRTVHLTDTHAHYLVRDRWSVSGGRAGVRYPEGVTN
jgi:hypothetical protein